VELPRAVRTGRQEDEMSNSAVVCSKICLVSRYSGPAIHALLVCLLICSIIALPPICKSILYRQLFDRLWTSGESP
jgi:hypothetical protein